MSGDANSELIFDRVPSEIDKGTARIFLLLKQKLLPPRSVWGKRGMTQIITRLRCIQQDDIDVVGRMPNVVLQSRVANYSAEYLNELLYSDRMLIEYYDKGLSIIPIDDLWIFGNRLARYAEGHAHFFGSHKGLVDKITETIKYQGPLSNLDIEKNTDIPMYWEDAKEVDKALLALWESGELVIHHRDGATAYYDLARRVLPKKMQAHINSMPLQQYWDYKFIRRINAVGMLPTIGGGDAWANIGRSETRAECGRRLKSAGVLNTVAVKDSPRHYMYLAKDIPLLQAAVELKDRDDLARDVSFIAPLDNLLWDTKTIEDLFGFQYKWEANIAPPLRVFGFFVLPILYGARFVGRLDPFRMAQEDILEIRGLFWEPGFNPVADKVFVTSFVSALADFMGYLGVQHLRFTEKAKPIPKEITEAIKTVGIKIRR